MPNCDKVSETDLIKAVTKEFEDKLNNKKIELQMKSQMSYSTRQERVTRENRRKDCRI